MTFINNFFFPFFLFLGKDVFASLALKTIYENFHYPVTLPGVSFHYGTDGFFQFPVHIDMFNLIALNNIFTKGNFPRIENISWQIKLSMQNHVDINIIMILVRQKVFFKLHSTVHSGSNGFLWIYLVILQLLKNSHFNETYGKTLILGCVCLNMKEKPDTSFLLHICCNF